ncbi:hypothetical protein ACFO26_04180 [Lactococcus nasutitermitis]|uniref:Uncharacterized protein n=1 Tax=Lactococcus nasutitermitis TaxID=1652957 RepID=A0ABV9JC63_9LACT|nr:hypothetical protein [Lactococcus nasutitermitis]
MKPQNLMHNKKHNRLATIGIFAGFLALFVGTAVTFFIPAHPDYGSVTEDTIVLQQNENSE